MKNRWIIILLCLSAAQGAWAWNGRLHMDITRAAAKAEPEPVRQAEPDPRDECPDIDQHQPGRYSRS